MDSKRKNPQEIFRMEGEGEVKSEEKGGQEGPQRWDLGGNLCDKLQKTMEKWRKNFMGEK